MEAAATTALMEKSELEAPKNIQISQTNHSIENRRRRPLRSRTVDTFLRILSICADSSHIIQASDEGNTVIGSHTKDGAPLAHVGILPNDLLCQEEVSMEKTRVVLGTQEGDLYNVPGGREGIFHKADKCSSNSQDNYDNLSSMLSIGDEQSIPKIHIEAFNGQIEVDREVSNNEDGNALEPSLDEKRMLRVSNPSVDANKVHPQRGESALADVNNEVQHRVMELEKLISATDLIDSSLPLVADKDSEEGEISGELMDFIPEDDPQLMDKSMSEVQVPEDFIGIEPQTGPANNTNLIPLSAEAIDDLGKDKEGVVTKTNRNLVDYSEIAVHKETIQGIRLDRYRGRREAKESLKQGGAVHLSPLRSILKSSATKIHDLVSPNEGTGDQNEKKKQTPPEEKRPNKKVKQSVNPTVCPNNLAMLGENSRDASQEVVDASTKKQDVTVEKKKKRVLTEERKEQKKKRKRIKRAEKNKKLGVKRLKLQPVIKEKKITYCRHFLKGRCHEGEKCKFSHDTIPLTKSTPCSHFARQSCMKGDDCPFDHQLSKYPCDNFQTQGFCSRGSNCMFSHEAQPSEASTASGDSKPESKSSSVQENSSSKKITNFNKPSRAKIDTKSSSIPISTNKSTEQNLVETTPKLSSRPPKGISFLSPQNSSIAKANSSSKVESSLTPIKVDSEVKGCEKIHGTSDEITKTTPVIPRGINFLSFGKKPLDYSNSNFSFKIGKSPLSNLVVGAKSSSTVNEGQISQNTHCNNENKVNPDLSTRTPDSSQKPILPYMSSSLQKALQSTLAFASKFDSGVKSNIRVDSTGSLAHGP